MATIDILGSSAPLDQASEQECVHELNDNDCTTKTAGAVAVEVALMIVWTSWSRNSQLQFRLTCCSRLMCMRMVCVADAADLVDDGSDIL